MNGRTTNNDKPTQDAVRAEWIKPAIVRMDPGSAEAGGRANPDGPAGNS